MKWHGQANCTPNLSVRYDGSTGSQRHYFDIYVNPGRHATVTPYLLDVLDSRMVIPLRNLEHFPKVKLPGRLTPVVTIKGRDFLLETPKMGAIPRQLLTMPVLSLREMHAEITSALDFLFHGY